MMIDCTTRSALLCALAATVALAACSSNNSTQPSATTTTTTTTSTPISKSLAAPSPVSPLSGTTVGTRPVLTVTNAARTGTFSGWVTYTFDLSDTPAFVTLVNSASVGEGSGQTSYTPTVDLGAGKTYYWRATAVASSDSVTSAASSTQTIAVLTLAAQIAAQQNVTLWGGTQPPGTPGNARMGPGWSIGPRTSWDGFDFFSPPIEALRLFDLFDRGMDPDAAIRWMKSNGYPSVAAYYPEVKAVGLPYQYLALVNGAWELVYRVGA